MSTGCHLSPLIGHSLCGWTLPNQGQSVTSSLLSTSLVYKAPPGPQGEMGIKGVPLKDEKQDIIMARSKQKPQQFTLESHGLPRKVLLGNY